jgi:hypothetical protein
MRIVVGLALAAAFFAALVISLRNQAQVECEVCIEFRGRSECRTNLAVDRDRAVLEATANACALLAGGVTDGIQCSSTPPRSVQCKGD